MNEYTTNQPTRLKEELKKCGLNFFEDADHAVGGYIARKELFEKLLPIIQNEISLALSKQKEELIKEMEDMRFPDVELEYETTTYNHGYNNAINDILSNKEMKQ